MKVIKSLSIVLLALTALSCSDKAEKSIKTDWEKMSLKGKVKSIKRTVYEFSDNDGQREKHLSASVNMLFNDKGIGIYVNGYLSERDSCIVKYSSYIAKYNEQEAKREVLSYSADSLLTQRGVTQFDDRGNMLEQARYDGNGSLKSRFTWAYNNNGDIVEEAWYNASDSLTRKKTYLYNDKGQLLEDRRWEEGDSLAWRNTYLYDEQGNQEQQITFYPDSSIYNKVIYKYDDKGHKLEEVKYNYMDVLRM